MGTFLASVTFTRLYQLSLGQSLGCVLFALCYSHSPFENTQTTEQGGSIAMAVLNARYKHPASNYSAGLKALIDSMLKVNPAERPDINQVCPCPILSSYRLKTHLALGFGGNEPTSAELIRLSEVSRPVHSHLGPMSWTVDWISLPIYIIYVTFNDSLLGFLVFREDVASAGSTKKFRPTFNARFDRKRGVSLTCIPPSKRSRAPNVACLVCADWSRG